MTLIALWAGLTLATPATGEAPAYRIYALHIGTTPDARRKTFVVDPEMPDRVPISFAFWVIKGAGRNILVDSGFSDKSMVKRWRIERHRDPVVALTDVGLLSMDITDVIITHRHWDHLWGLTAFEKATIWIHQKELSGILSGTSAKEQKVRRFLKSARRDKRLRVTGGSEVVAPGIRVHHIGLHTPGFQCVVVDNPEGSWVIASDIGPLRANFERKSPTGLSSNRAAAKVALDQILGWADGELDRVVPGHEPSYFTQRPSVELTAPPAAGEPPADP